ncbi:type I-E CRISPR-associated protein Cas6/Cse3/CasE [Oryzibacter oryziterrae]|uniref:type I-E CRISPR-associated protein Cas6/Cse3/CasE n=1 Tax=Oryzibacter oryziterrae TaxID=2766474 RepID=UPI001EFF6542|nr:type I-E CRISPR-associated protein Cas6/Cse3/CasE [Oryzibacter oryziterrae]
MTELFLTRASLTESFDVLGPVLFPADPAHKMAIAHRLVWTLFPPDLKERPFLYRETAPSQARGRAARGEFYILSSIAPRDDRGLFRLETKPFAPCLVPGDILQFSLRANPTVQKSEMEEGQRKTRRFDVVMHALHDVPSADRAKVRPELIRKAGLDWLARQGERAGFRLVDPEAVHVDGYEQFDADPEGRRRVRSQRQPGHSRLDFEGQLEVVDPALFVEAIGRGFGRARAFGHGLMLIRRPAT